MTWRLLGTQSAQIVVERAPEKPWWWPPFLPWPPPEPILSIIMKLIEGYGNIAMGGDQ